MNARTSSPLRRSVIRASVDGFHNPRAVRYEGGRYSPEGYFENSYNYAALKQCFLDPLSPGGRRRRLMAWLRPPVEWTNIVRPRRAAGAFLRDIALSATMRLHRSRRLTSTHFWATFLAVDTTCCLRPPFGVR
jgi:hypothetical protein